MAENFTQKYTIVQLLEAMPDGAEYYWRDWPLHVTIADIFATNWEPSTIVEKLSQLLAKRRSFEVLATGGLCLGSRGVPVMLLELSNDLRRFHFDVIDMLEEGDVRFNTPQYIREGWLPHSTVQRHAGLQPGDMVTFDTLTLIDLFPDQDGYRRKIIATIPFGE